MEPDLIETITTWLRDHADTKIGKKYGNEYFCVPIRRRRELFKILVARLKSQGKEKSYFRSVAVTDAITKVCFPPEEMVHNVKDRRNGLKAAKGDLEAAVSYVYDPKPDPSESQQISAPKPVVTEYDPSKGKPLAKQLDRTKLDGAPRPTTDIDPEAAAILGFSDDE